MEDGFNLHWIGLNPMSQYDVAEQFTGWYPKVHFSRLSLILNFWRLLKVSKKSRIRFLAFDDFTTMSMT
jgi:hypothetical protein